MDPFAPIAGISLEQYAELYAMLTMYEGMADLPAEMLHERGISPDQWTEARTEWTNRLEDPAVDPALAVRFVPAYHAALDRAHGPAPTLTLDAYVALSAEIQHQGATTTIRRLGLARHRLMQIDFSWNVSFSRDPQQYVNYACLLHIEMARLARGEAPRPIPALGPAIPAEAPSPQAPAPVEYAAPVPVPNPSVVAPVVPAAAPAPVAKSLEQEASEAAHAVEGALKSGLGKLGGALDAFGRSLNKPGVGSRVLVAWSDGNKYPGMVADMGQGQYFVTMADGRQLWVPETYVSHHN